jgi:hypothetical protein
VAVNVSCIGEIVAGAVLVAAAAGAQDAVPSRAPGRADFTALIRAEQEPSYASIPWLLFGLPREMHTGGNLRVLYEATVAPPFFVSLGHAPLVIAVTPKIVIRQYAGGFYPVPPPSYMPRVTMYYWGRPYARRTRADSIVYAFLRLSHHSNGQDSDYFTSTNPPRVNYATGKFSTNFLELGLVQPMVHGGPIVGAQELSVEWHPPGWTRVEIRPIYAPLRVHLTSHVELLRPRLGPLEGAVLSLGYLGGPTTPNRRSVASRGILSYTIYSGVGQLGDFALFANYYTGEDYYNIRFDRNISTFKIGALAGVRRLPAGDGTVQALPAMRDE